MSPGAARPMCVCAMLAISSTTSTTRPWRVGCDPVFRIHICPTHLTQSPSTTLCASSTSLRTALLLSIYGCVAILLSRSFFIIHFAVRFSKDLPARDAQDLRTTYYADADAAISVYSIDCQLFLVSIHVDCFQLLWMFSSPMSSSAHCSGARHACMHRNSISCL